MESATKKYPTVPGGALVTVSNVLISIIYKMVFATNTQIIAKHSIL